MRRSAWGVFAAARLRREEWRGATWARSPRSPGRGDPSAAFAGVSLAPRLAAAQQPTFHLDRLEVPGAPDDGDRPFPAVDQPKPTFYAQLGLGYSADPLRTSDITNNPTAFAARRQTNVITTQFSTYMSGGVEFLDRLTLGFTFPVGLGPVGQPAGVSRGGNLRRRRAPTIVLDDRARRRRHAARRSLRHRRTAPTARSAPSSASSFRRHGLDDELRRRRARSADAPMHHRRVTRSEVPLADPSSRNPGIDIRHDNSINNPDGKFGPPDGLGIGDEWRWARRARSCRSTNGRFRLGATIFGQTGITNDDGHRAHRSSRAEHAHRVERRGAHAPAHVGLGRTGSSGLGGGSLIAPTATARRTSASSALVGTYFAIEDTHPQLARARDAHPREHPRVASRTPTATASRTTSTRARPSPRTTRTPTRTTAAPRRAIATATASPTSSTSARTSPRTRTASTTRTAAPRTTPTTTASPTRRTPARRSPASPIPIRRRTAARSSSSSRARTVRVLQQVHFATGSADHPPRQLPDARRRSRTS